MKGKEPWTFRHDSVDSSTTAKVDDPRATPIAYPKPDGKLSFPLLENVARAVVDHADTQPSHLVVKDEFRDSMVGKTARSLREFGAPEANFCPAGVYEYPDDELVINAQNCVHCKCCSIKMPLEYIKWHAVWKSTSELGYSTSRRWRGAPEILVSTQVDGARRGRGSELPTNIELFIHSIIRGDGVGGPGGR